MTREPALMTRATLARIRQAADILSASAIAEELGWNIPRLERVCRAHGIALVHGSPVAAQIPVDLRAVIECVAPRQAEVLLILACHADRFLSGDEIQGRLGLASAQSWTSETMAALRAALVRVGAPYTIESRQRKNGGFRLVRREQPKPAPVTAKPAPRALPVDLQTIINQLPTRQADVLRILAHQDGTPIRAEDIILLTRRKMTPENLGMVIFLLRRSLESLGAPYRVATVWGRGYRLERRGAP